MRRFGVLVIGVAVVATIGLGVPPAGAAKVVGVGDVHCEGDVRIRGIQTRVPNLTPRADGGNLRMTVLGNLACTGTTGNPNVIVARARVSGVLSRTFECVFDSGFFGPNPPPLPPKAPGLTFDLKWKPAKLAATKVVFSNFQGTRWWDQRELPFPVMRQPRLTMPATGGTVTTTGSYAGVGTASADLQLPVYASEQMDLRCGDGRLRPSAIGRLALDL
jgi:hypothetical protein